MHRWEVLDHRHQASRAATIAVLTILLLGMALGGTVGVALARGFDAIHLEQHVRHFAPGGSGSSSSR